MVVSFQKGDQGCVLTTITVCSLPGQVYAGMLEKRVQLTVETQIQEERCKFCPGLGALDQLYTLARILEGAWELAQPVNTWTIVSLCGVLQE